MAFKIFISHSIEDMELVHYFKSMLSQKGLETYVAVSEPEPGRKITDKITNHIKSSSHVLLLLTKKAAESSWVQNEIGIAVSMKKTIIPIIEAGVKIPSIIKDIEYVTFDSENPNECIIKISEYLFNLKTSSDEVKLLIGILLIFLGILGIAAFLSKYE